MELRDQFHCPVALPKGKYHRFFFSGEGPRSRRYERTAALRLLVQLYDEDEEKEEEDDDYDDDYYFLSFS
jgi:hypothetical protein